MATEKKEKKAPARRPTAKRTQEATAPAAQAAGDAAAPRKSGIEGRREVVGFVESDKMQKTIVVRVDRRVRHRLYKKYVTMSRRFKAHDEQNDAKIGDLVVLVESRPLSRDKRWALKKIVRRAGQAPEANV